MSTTSSSAGADRLEARIARLERRNSITSGACAIMALGLAGAVLGGAGENEEKAPWLTASGLTIVDSAGIERIHLAAQLPALADACGLQMLNPEGAETTSLTSRTSGQTMLTVSDGTTDRVAAGVWASGEGGLYVLGPEAMPGYRGQLAVDADGRTYYILRGSDEEYITRIGEPGGGGASQAQANAIQPPAGNAWQQNMGGAGAGGWRGGAGAGMGGAGGWPGGAGAGMPVGAGAGAGMPGAAGAGGWPGGAGAGMPGAGGAGGWPGGAGAGMPGATGAGAGAPGAGEIPGLENLPEDVRQRIEEMRERARKMREESMQEAERMRQGAGEDGEAPAEPEDADSDDSETEEESDPNG